MTHLRTLIGSGIALWLACCGSSPAPAVMIRHANGPDWVNEGSGAFRVSTGQVFRGVGIAAGIHNAALRRSTANSRARSETEKTLESYAKVLAQDYRESNPADPSSSSEAQVVQDALHNCVERAFLGTLIVDHWVDDDGTEYSLAQLDLPSFQNSIEQMRELNTKVRDVLRTRADAAFDRLAGSSSGAEVSQSQFAVRPRDLPVHSDPPVRNDDPPAPQRSSIIAPEAPAQPAIRAATAAPVLVLPPGTKLAVLEFKNSLAELGAAQIAYLSDEVRQAILNENVGMDVMTRENLLVLLQASGKDLSNCEGECEVDTGRRIGADAVVSGDLLRFGTHFKLTLKLHETKMGRLLSSATATGKTIDDLDEQTALAVKELFKRMH